MAERDQDLLLVDLEDRPLGTIDKAGAHQRPRLHRAFSVFLFQGERMLIQKRAAGKYHSGGLWSNACCSHPRKGEELVAAARSRTLEEVGADCPLEEIFSFVYCHRFQDRLYEYEYDHVLVGEWDGVCHPDPAEVEELRWVDIPELERQLLENPEQFSVWFLIAAPRVLAYWKKRGLQKGFGQFDG